MYWRHSTPLPALVGYRSEHCASTQAMRSLLSPFLVDWYFILLLTITEGHSCRIVLGNFSSVFTRLWRNSVRPRTNTISDHVVHLTRFVDLLDTRESKLLLLRSNVYEYIHFRLCLAQHIQKRLKIPIIPNANRTYSSNPPGITMHIFQLQQET
jgi:hypothetical protein